MTSTAEILKGLPYFADLDDDLLDRVCQLSEQIEIASGDVIIEEGTSSEEMYVIALGELRVVKRSGEREVELARLTSGHVVGEIALLDEAPRTATVVAETNCLLVRVPMKAFEILLSDSDVVRRMFRTVTSRLRGIEDSLRHEERMAALGRMAAQLMHELNNPAAAVGRTSKNLSEVTTQLNALATQMMTTLTGGVDLNPPATESSLTPLQRSEHEDELAFYLEELGIDECWELAPSLVEIGWHRPALEAGLEVADEDLRADLARWAGLRATANQLTGEISIGASRISELVRVVKDYSYLDQAPVQSVEVAKGISDTLILLKHKLRDVKVTTDFSDDLPTVEAPGRDLNQIWTNLIDNAADAIDGEGSLTIRAGRDGDHVVVTISDSGPGIPDDVVEKIFDPFFTTKDPGKGTGLGLHTVATIVARVGGEITVDAGDSGTTFTVSLPLG